MNTKQTSADMRVDSMIRLALLEIAEEKWQEIETLNTSDVHISERHDRRMRSMLRKGGTVGTSKKPWHKWCAAAACLCLIVAGVLIWTRMQQETAPHQVTLYYNEVTSVMSGAPLFREEIATTDIELKEASVLLGCDLNRCIPAAMKSYVCKCIKAENTEMDEVWNVIVDIREDNESDTAPGVYLDVTLKGKPSSVDYTYTDAEVVWSNVSGVEVCASVIPATKYTTASGRERTIPGVYIAEFTEGGFRYYVESRGTLEQTVFDEFVCDMIIKGLKRSVGNPLEADDLIEHERADILEDFAFTDFSSTALSENATPEDAASTEEYFDDPKTALFSRMLNTVDYFDRLFLSSETNMIGASAKEIDFDIDLTGELSYQAVREVGNTISETFSCGTGMVMVDHGAKLCVRNYLPVYTKEDAPYIPLSERITVMDDGIPVYAYRNNITNCPLASYTVFPQEIAFSYLKDFDDWEIEKTGEVYLGRNCTVLKGTPSPYMASKHGINAFRMTIDEETGILLCLEGTKDGDIVEYVTVTAIDFEPTEGVRRFDENLCAGYRMESR